MGKMRECESQEYYETNAELMGFDRVWGYYAWFVGCGAIGHHSAMDFLKDLRETCEPKKVVDKTEATKKAKAFLESMTMKAKCAICRKPSRVHKATGVCLECAAKDD